MLTGTNSCYSSKNYTHKIPAVIMTLILCVFLLSLFYTKVYAADDKVSDWSLFHANNDKYTLSADRNVKYGECPYSIKIENTGYNFVGLSKKFELKPNTQYRVSVMMKYSGYEPENADGGVGGQLRVAYPDGKQSGTKSSNSKDWVQLQKVFTTDSEGNCTIWLANGGLCKGTAWFSDFKLEEVVSTTNQWNILVLVFKNIDADAIKYNKNEKGEAVEEKFRAKANIPDAEAEKLKNSLETSFASCLPKLSDGLLGVRDVDVCIVDDTVKTLCNKPGDSLTGNDMDPMLDKTISNAIDSCFEKKDYQQIVFVIPSIDAGDGWAGLASRENTYKGVYYVQVKYFTEKQRERIPIPTDNEKNKDYPISVYVHEIMHTLEADSREINSDITAETHGNVLYYMDSYNDSDGWYKYHHDFLTSKLPDGKGIDPKAFYRPSRYVLISDDLTPDIGAEKTASLPVHISKVAGVEVNSEMTFDENSSVISYSFGTSKKITKDTDYTVAFFAEEGTEFRKKLVIKGIDDYYGTIEKEIVYKLAKTAVKAKKKTLKWNAVYGAEGYEIYYCKGKGNYKLLNETSSLSASVSKLKKGKYKFKIRAYAGDGLNRTYGDFSKVVSVKIK